MRRTRCGAVAMAMVGALVAMVALAGCAATRAPRGEPGPSGFLGDYSQLRKNPDYPAALVYVKPGVQWARYRAIQLDSAGLWLSEATSKLSAEDRDRLTAMLYNTLHGELDRYFTLASAPGPNTLRLRVALTQARGARVLARTVTTVVPQLRAATTLGSLATDTAGTVGSATVEGEALDSVTNERLAAAVDERIGTKALFAKRAYEEWGDVQAAMDYWAERLTWQLARHGVQLKPGASMPEEPKEGRSL